MHRMIDRLVDDPDRQTQCRANTGRHTGPQMHDVIDAVFVQAHAFGKINRNFVGGGDTAD